MISKGAKLGNNITIKEGVIIEDDVSIGDNCYIDYGCIIRKGVLLGDNCYIGPYTILGEYQMDFHRDHSSENINYLDIGKNSLIRSHCVIYGGSIIGDNFQTGHHVTIRENTVSGKNWRVGTFSDIQGDCKIGDYVNMHSNVHVGKHTQVGNYVWIFPYCIFTNDPLPPSEYEKGCNIGDYSVIATGSIVLPDTYIGKDTLVGAGSIVTKDVLDNSVVIGSPARVKGGISEIIDPFKGGEAYPWAERFDRGMPWKGVNFKEWKCTKVIKNKENKYE